MVNSATEFLALVGFPIKHSLSPQIHNFLFKKYAINAVYGCFAVSNLESAVKGLLALGFRGFNVTIPYKEKVIPYLHRIDREAKIIGAVNTVKIEGKRLLGFNTDGKGFISSLKRSGFRPEGKSILILGAGGAGRAVGVYLAKAKVERLDFYDLIYSKSRKLAQQIRSSFPSLSTGWIKEKKKINLQNYDLLINASGAGLHKRDPLPLRLDNFRKNLVVYDLIYNPPLTPFLEEAQKKGLQTINGLWMLIYQAIEAEKIWFGIECEGEAPYLYKMLLGQLRK